MKVEVAVLGSSSLTNLMVSVDVKQHLKKTCLAKRKERKNKFGAWTLYSSLLSKQVQ